MQKSTYYLSDSTRGLSHFLVFEATFAESCEIDKCYIVAYSLKHASDILYKELFDSFGVDYLDSQLLCLKFKTVLDFYE